ncbi:hypothetical protein HT746_19200 [Burkholderia pyrrocinia]|uniref:hypothetical protein n=1 Tax=Burkholderia pyrrocinia TaxID=60550 RepID=UPI001576AEC3|nr:hypothetical protein [Burkholderia pyrrocinia]NTX29229.1 hypothetical protein [Burkholderia pyrrocinia]
MKITPGGQHKINGITWTIGSTESLSVFYKLFAALVYAGQFSNQSGNLFRGVMLGNSVTIRKFISR